MIDLELRNWRCCSCRKVFRVVKEPPVLCTVLGSYCSVCRDSLEEKEIVVDMPRNN